jgi:hypothetical protein
VARVETPRREWLAVLFPPATAAVLLAAGAVEAASTPNGWPAFAAAFTAGVTPPLVYTVVLAREGRLFLRREEDVERERARIARIAVPVGWLVGGALLAASLAVAGVSAVVLEAMLGGLALGFWPGLLANFLRLRRETWTQ